MSGFLHPPACDSLSLRRSCRGNTGELQLQTRPTSSGGECYTGPVSEGKRSARDERREVGRVAWDGRGGVLGAFLSSSMGERHRLSIRFTCTDTVPVSTAPQYQRHSPSLPYSMHIRGLCSRFQRPHYDTTHITGSHACS